VWQLHAQGTASTVPALSRSPKALSAAAKRSTFVYCEDEPGSRAAAKLLTRDQARRIAARHREAAPFHRNVSEIVDLNY